MVHALTASGTPPATSAGTNTSTDGHRLYARCTAAAAGVTPSFASSSRPTTASSCPSRPEWCCSDAAASAWSTLVLFAPILMLRIKVLVSHLISPSRAARISPSTRSFFRPALPDPLSFAIARNVSSTTRTVKGFGLASVTCLLFNAAATSPKSPSVSFIRPTLCLETPATSAMQLPTVAPPTTSSLPTSCLSAHRPNVRYTAANTSRGARSMISTNKLLNKSPFLTRLADDDVSSKHRERMRYGASFSDVGHAVFVSPVRAEVVGSVDGTSGADLCSARVGTVGPSAGVSSPFDVGSEDSGISDDSSSVFGVARAWIGVGAWSVEGSVRSS